MPNLWPKNWRLFGQFLAISIGFASIFEWLAIPLGALMGPILGAGLLAYFKNDREGPGHYAQGGAILVVGLALGAQVTPDFIERALHWPGSMAILIVTMCIILWVVGWLNRWLFRLDAISAHMSASPGNLSVALTLTDHYQGQLPQVAVFQSLRLTLLTILVPIALHQLSGLPSTSAIPSISGPVNLSWIAVFLAGALIAFGLDRFKVPTPSLIAGALAAGIPSAMGWIEVQIPSTLFLGAMMIFGWKIGIDTIRQGLTVVSRALGPAILSTAVAVCIAVIGAWGVSTVLDIPLIDTVLAFMPGAFQVMPVLALEQGADGLYVTTHHLIRVIAMGSLMPIFAVYWART
ncbi:MAG: AbrB family transcriptional regulator [Litorivicinaceae bacterium]